MIKWKSTLNHFSLFTLHVMCPLFLQINVVNEDRLYQSWSDNPRLPGVITDKSGIIRAKKALNILHQNLAQTGFTQV